ncbi:uncharacterized protein VTP21DRAFT_656 [Calcarisporiella thermophila]|uniref:uncharacterized protein n=1 Tax=Calcarisporiella thermophila TaxID=911321 RepID=UPI003742E060
MASPEHFLEAEIDDNSSFEEGLVDEWWHTKEEITDDDVRNGLDMQGIQWDAVGVTRQRYRELRLIGYSNYESVTEPNEGVSIKVMPEIQSVKTDAEYYKFKYTKLSERCSLVHFQLRNLLWVPSKNDVFYTQGPRVQHWCPITHESRTVMAMDKSEVYGSVYPTKITTMACREDVLLVGGFCGEYACRRLDAEGTYTGFITKDSNGITNYVDITRSRSGGLCSIISSNDKRTRTLDLERLEFTQSFEFQWPVNCATMSPDKRLLCVVGDGTETLLLNAESGEVLTVLDGHLDHSFACSWSPDGILLATGNQDKTSRLYDVRFLSKPLCVLGAQMGAIRSLRFSDDGKFFAMAEPADFVHVFDVTNFDRSQLIDFFGEIAGFSFTPDAEGLYIANADNAYGSILEFERAFSTVNYVMDWL